MVQHFNNLDVEKQNNIINSAMNVFGSNNYQKAYMSEIAKEANISKASLFYYFNTKLDLYKYIIDVTVSEILSSVDVEEVSQEKDFFKCIYQASVNKMESLRRRPFLTKFLTKFYFETEEEIVTIRNHFLEVSANYRQKLVFEELDVSRFKATVDPKLVMDMLVKWSEGYMGQFEKIVTTATVEQTDEFFDKMIDDFYQLITMLEVNFYK